MSYKEEKADFDNRKYVSPYQNRLNEYQLQDLEKELERFTSWKDVKKPKPERIRVFDERAWMKNRGALSHSGGVIVKNFKPAVYTPQGTCKEPADSEPILFEQLSEDLKQFAFWKGRKEFIERKKIEGLEELAQGMEMPAKSSEWDAKKKFLGV